MNESGYKSHESDGKVFNLRRRPPASFPAKKKERGSKSNASIGNLGGEGQLEKPEYYNFRKKRVKGGVGRKSEFGNAKRTAKVWINERV